MCVRVSWRKSYIVILNFERTHSARLANEWLADHQCHRQMIGSIFARSKSRRAILSLRRLLNQIRLLNCIDMQSNSSTHHLILRLINTAWGTVGYGFVKPTLRRVTLHQTGWFLKRLFSRFLWLTFSRKKVRVGYIWNRLCDGAES